MDIHLVLSNDDLLYQRLDDAALLVGSEVWPPIIEGAGTLEDLFFGQVPDLEDVEFGLGYRQFVVQLAKALRPRVIFGAESALIDHSGLIQIVQFVDFARKLFAFGFENVEKLGFAMDRGIGSIEVGTDFVRRNREVLDLLYENGFQIVAVYLIPAGLTRVLGALG